MQPDVPFPPPDAGTRLAAVLGHPVAHSLSPAMHNAAFLAAGLNAVYLAFDVPPAAFAAAVRGLVAVGFLGANVTLPHKAAAAALADHRLPPAALTGAANTLWAERGRLVADNTDGPGFLHALAAAGYDPAGRGALVLGAGGAGAAVALALAGAGARPLCLANRHPARADALAGRAAAVAPGAAATVPWTGEALAGAARRCGLIVHATPMGMAGGPPPEGPPAPDASPGLWDGVGPDHWVCDLVYRPRETGFLRAARARGARALDGLGMLLHQGALAFERWTGGPAPVDAMAAALEAALTADPLPVGEGPGYP